MWWVLEKIEQGDGVKPLPDATVEERWEYVRTHDPKNKTAVA